MHNQLPKWDLSDLYQSINDPQINTDLQQITGQIQLLRRDFYQKISSLNPAQLNNFLEKYEQISDRICKISTYCYLQYATNLNNQQVLAFFQDNQEKIAYFSGELVFAINEIVSLDLAKLQSLQHDPALAKYQPFLRDLIFSKPHHLNEQLEKLNIDKNITGSSAFIRLFDETINNLQFNYNGKKLNSSQIFNLLSESDRQIRQQASEEIAKVFSENSKIFTFITNTLAKDKQVQDQWRQYPTPISSRNSEEFLPDEVVEIMIDTIKKNYSKTAHRYYKLKAKILKLDKLEFYDRNAPLPYKSNKIFSWQQAKDIVISSYKQFSPQMAEIAEKFFTNNWIDAKIYDGKDSGAFSHPCTTSVHPYILLNYQEKIRDVATLAHELGHGVHQYLARKQGYLQSSTPITLAETASIFGEELVFQKILQNINDKDEKISLIANKIEDIINTAVRQIAFCEFEKRVHQHRQQGELSSEQICKFWLEVQQQSLGDAFNFGDNYAYFWCYIPHFIHTPFYVYAYAFGYCLVSSLYATYQQNNIPNFIDKYLAMLESGGSKWHEELLQQFGLSMYKQQFWQFGIDSLINYINQLEQLISS
jgi:oligoendopeptidase F